MLTPTMVRKTLEAAGDSHVRIVYEQNPTGSVYGVVKQINRDTGILHNTLNHGSTIVFSLKGIAFIEINATPDAVLTALN